MNVRSKRLKTRNLPQNNKRIDRVNSKPYVFIVLSLCAGCVMIYKNHYFIGSLISVLFLYNLVCIKNKIIMEFYPDYVVFYAEHEKDECFILFWEDVESWSYHIGKNDLDTVNVTLKDQSAICFKSLSKRKTMRHFKKYASSKQNNTVKQQI